MEIRVLEYFLMVANEKNITRAANALNITQPTLSRQLSQLEDELGKQLFIRGKRQIQLTEEGILLKRRAEEIVSLVNKTHQEITQSEEEMVGQITIGTGIFKSSQTFLIDTIEKFNQKYPLVNFDIYTGNADLIKERVNQGLVDIGVVLDPVDVSNYNYLRLPIFEQWGIIISINNKLVNNKYILKDDLINSDVFIANRDMIKSEIFNWLKKDNANINYTYNFVSAILPLIKDNKGVAVAIKGAYDILNNDGIAFIPFYPEIKTTTSIIWKKHIPLSPIVNQFIKQLQKELEEGDDRYEK